ncbi:MAG: RNA polymerase factor sigma-54 [Acidobacteriota bacterium]|nr:RNA polymerase factor sigma-54 [Acidobacteriota bacterium]MDH3524943.1 RNA polymerase factor sigma-54 [Acidobacteriota bacterium]
MALEQKLSLKLAQRLVMTPSLQQAIKLLQMTRLELQSVVTQELVENPILEEVEEQLDGPTEEEAESTADGGDGEAEPASESAGADDFDVEAYLANVWDSSSEPRTWENREAPPLENTLAREPDLYDHLLWQLHMSDISPRLCHAAELVIGNLDPDGFLVATVDEISEMARGDEETAGITEEEVMAAVEIVQGLDPPGIACPDLRLSLLHQLDARREPEESLARRIVAEDWDLFLRRQLPALARKYGVDLHELEPVVDVIKTLQTRPGRLYNADRTQYVTPDVYVRKLSGEYVIQLNDEGLPRLRLSRAYRQMLKDLQSDGTSGDAQAYIKDKVRSALWLIKSLDQRQRTIYKVAESIVRQQRDFLDHGIEHLRPMVLRDVAADIGMHESTVSRVVSNKYIHTPRGLSPMKFFFHSGIDRDYGDDISSLTVKRKIEQLIQEENPRKPISDRGLASALQREGINIARRTVAKYRDELGVPSSTHRKKIF